MSSMVLQYPSTSLIVMQIIYPRHENSVVRTPHLNPAVRRMVSPTPATPKGKVITVSRGGCEPGSVTWWPRTTSLPQWFQGMCLKWCVNCYLIQFHVSFNISWQSLPWTIWICISHDPLCQATHVPPPSPEFTQRPPQAPLATVCASLFTSRRRLLTQMHRRKRESFWGTEKPVDIAKIAWNLR